MEKQIEAQRSEEEEFTTFEDIFALALANTEHSRFIADSNEWHKVLFEICKEYRDELPQLRAIFFQERPPLPPRTKEFYELIATLYLYLV